MSRTTKSSIVVRKDVKLLIENDDYRLEFKRRVDRKFIIANKYISSIIAGVFSASIFNFLMKHNTISTAFADATKVSNESWLSQLIRFCFSRETLDDVKNKADIAKTAYDNEKTAFDNLQQRSTEAIAAAIERNNSINQANSAAIASAETANKNAESAFSQIYSAWQQTVQINTTTFNIETEQYKTEIDNNYRRLRDEVARVTEANTRNQQDYIKQLERVATANGQRDTALEEYKETVIKLATEEANKYNAKVKEYQEILATQAAQLDDIRKRNSELETEYNVSLQEFQSQYNPAIIQQKLNEAITAYNNRVAQITAENNEKIEQYRLAVLDVIETHIRPRISVQQEQFERANEIFDTLLKNLGLDPEIIRNKQQIITEFAKTKDEFNRIYSGKVEGIIDNLPTISESYRNISELAKTDQGMALISRYFPEEIKNNPELVDRIIRQFQNRGYFDENIIRTYLTPSKTLIPSQGDRPARNLNFEADDARLDELISRMNEGLHRIAFSKVFEKDKSISFEEFRSMVISQNAIKVRHTGDENSWWNWFFNYESVETVKALRQKLMSEEGFTKAFKSFYGRKFNSENLTEIQQIVGRDFNIYTSRVGDVIIRFNEVTSKKDLMPPTMIPLSYDFSKEVPKPQFTPIPAAPTADDITRSLPNRDLYSPLKPNYEFEPTFRERIPPESYVPNYGTERSGLYNHYKAQAGIETASEMNKPPTLQTLQSDTIAQMQRDMRGEGRPVLSLPPEPVNNSTQVTPILTPLVDVPPPISSNKFNPTTPVPDYNDLRYNLNGADKFIKEYESYAAIIIVIIFGFLSSFIVYKLINFFVGNKKIFRSFNIEKYKAVKDNLRFQIKQVSPASDSYKKIKKIIKAHEKGLENFIFTMEKVKKDSTYRKFTPEFKLEFDKKLIEIKKL